MRAEARTKHTPETNSAERLVYYLELLKRHPSNPADPEIKRDLYFASDAITAVNFNPQTEILARWMATALYKVSADRSDGGPTPCSKYAGALIQLYDDFPHMWASPADWYTEASRYARLSLQRMMAHFTNITVVKTAEETQLDFLKRAVETFPAEVRGAWKYEIGFFYNILGIVLAKNPTPEGNDNTTTHEIREIASVFGFNAE